MTSAVRPAPPAIELRKRAEGFPLGNPGNGRQPIGDEYNWEALLAEVPATEDLHIVSGDRDYASSGNPTPRNLVAVLFAKSPLQLWLTGAGRDIAAAI